MGTKGFGIHTSINLPGYKEIAANEQRSRKVDHIAVLWKNAPTKIATYGINASGMNFVFCHLLPLIPESVQVLIFLLSPYVCFPFLTELNSTYGTRRLIGTMDSL